MPLWIKIPAIIAVIGIALFLGGYAFERKGLEVVGMLLTTPLLVVGVLLVLISVLDWTIRTVCWLLKKVGVL